MIPTEYEPIVVWLIFGILVPPIVKIMNWFLSPNYETIRNTKTTYECGEVPIGEAQRQYNFQFFTFAIVFVLFDVISIFILTFALVYRDPAIDMLQVLGIIVGVVALPLIGLVFWMTKNEILWS
ncbi:MAG: NADH-quinone oxidoreductase subunit A [Candidatus Heimdallarchaeota archaeon]